MQKIVGEAISDGLGYTTVAGSVIMTGLEWFAGFNVNEVLHTLASLGGIVFIVYKVQHISLEIKIRREDYKRKKKENDEE